MQAHIRDYRGKRVHMIGIGGSSMSGLAEMLIDQGYEVTGSDRTDGYLMDDVRAKGARVMIGHRAENVRGAGAGGIHRGDPGGQPGAGWRRRGLGHPRRWIGRRCWGN